MSIFSSTDNQPHLQFANDERNRACCFQVMKESDVFDYAGARIEIPDDFYDFILISFQEQHAEAVTVKNVLSDTFVAFATGARPVQISLQGMLPMLSANDARLDFHELYTSYFRGTRLKQQKLLLRFFVKKTLLNLYIQSMNMAVSADLEDMVSFNVSGLGAAYQVQVGSSRERYLAGLDSKYQGVPEIKVG